jgi:hopene-associated glycosyltransferase HpnB
VSAPLIVGLVSLAAWVGLAVHPARPWDLRPVGEDEPPPPDPAPWPEVAVVVPARNEAGSLPDMLPALLAQDYPGPWRVVLVDDRSEDDTASVARRLGGDRVEVVHGEPLPPGWVGKVWALDQGVRRAGRPEYLLFTDADIRHGPGSLRRLVAESWHQDLALNSRMALLRADSLPGRLLIPAFAFFFATLYPMRWVNAQRRRFAAAAGGCVLLRRSALDAAGGMSAIRGAIIDDVNLARAVAPHGRLRLTAGRSAVVSLRGYGSLGAVWRMVRRTAFAELRYSGLLLGVTVSALAVLFLAPPALVVAGAIAARWPWAAVGTGAWLLQAALYLPAVRRYALAAPWALTLPLAGVLYGAMTVDSAIRHVMGRGGRWT